MYKEVSIFKTQNSEGDINRWMKSFETKSDYKAWENERLLEGYKVVDEQCMVEPYPQVLKLDLKYSLGGYSTVIERFASSKDYTRYCDEKLMQGYKVIGSEPYKKFNNV